MKILNYHEPLLSTYPEYGTVFSILPQNELSENWMYSNFVQYYVKKNHLFTAGEELLIYKDHVNLMATVPTLQNYKVSDELISKMKYDSFLDALMDFIDSDFYIILLLDRSKIHGTLNFGKDPFIHMTLIYGYDKEEQQFYVADNDVLGRFTQLKYSFEDVNNAFDVIHYQDFRDTRTINLIRPFEHQNFSFDIQYLLRELKFYIESDDYKDTYLKNYNPYNPLNHGHDGETIEYYNLGVYDYLIQLAENPLNYVRIQPFHLLHENKAFMLKRILFLIERKYINNNKQLVKKWKDFVKQVSDVKYMVIKIDLCRTEKRIQYYKNRIKESLPLIKAKEVELLTELIAEIEKGIS